ncbi:MAG: NgoFVII family restriction endonuclease, partial [Anaerovoracaceae bacterium]
MDFLYSNFPPMRTKATTFAEAFYSLIPQTSQLDIAVGYITSDSLIELKRTAELNEIKKLNLIIGMHYWDKFTETEYRTAMDLNTYLSTSNRGEVRLVTPFRFHGKLYSYSNNNGAFAGIIGSNNLSSIIDGGSRTYEASALINDIGDARKIQQFIVDLSKTSTKNIAELDINKFK